jgi:hypothetical protein
MKTFARTLFSVTLVLFALLIPVKAQNSNDPCGCNAALGNGVFDIANKKNDKEAERMIASLVVHSTWEQFQNAKANKKTIDAEGGGGTLTMEAYGKFGYGDINTEEDFKAKHQELMNKNKDISREVTADELKTKIASPVIYAAWSRCMEICFTQNKQLPPGIYSYTQGESDDFVTIKIRFVGVGNPAILEDSIEGGSINGRRKLFSASEKTLPTGDTTLAIKKDGHDKAVVVRLRVSGSGISEVFPALELAKRRKSPREISRIDFPPQGIRDKGYHTYPRFLADVNGDGKRDYCRGVSIIPPDFHCELGSDDGGFKGGEYVSLIKIDYGDSEHPGWLDNFWMEDVNNDKKADFCRLLPKDGRREAYCVLAGASGFERDVKVKATRQGHKIDQ